MALQLDRSVDESAVADAAERLHRPGVTLAPRKMWPTALANLGIDLKGKITDAAEEGRAIARLTDLGHGQALRALFREDTPDGPVPRSLGDALVEVLEEWQPKAEAIAYVESARRPQLTSDLAAGVAAYLNVPILARWSIVDHDIAPGQGAANSAQRVAAVGRRFALQTKGPLPGRVLLLDDLVISGWTTTLAARALRTASAEVVLPMTLAVST